MNPAICFSSNNRRDKTQFQGPITRGSSRPNEPSLEMSVYSMATTTANNNSAAPAPSPARTGRNRRRRQIKWIIVAVVIVAAAIFGGRYWIEKSRFVETDNAYVQANQVDIAAQVSGPVTQVFVRNQQGVHAGDVLFQVDPRNYEIAVAKSRAQLELARQGMSQESAGIASAEAVLAQRRAEAENAHGVWQRNQQLMKSGFLSPQGAENARTQLATALIAAQIGQQAQMGAILDVFQVTMWSFLLMLPLVLLLRKSKRGGTPPPAAAME